MSGFLRVLINAKEPLFSFGLKQLEKSTAGSGIDLRLIADITEKTHDVMRKLKLDPKDTTGIELYNSLACCVNNNSFQDILDDTDYVIAMIGDDLILLNMIDVIENSHHELGYENRIIRHGQRSLCGEIVKRYMSHELTSEETTREILSIMGVLSDENT